MLENKTFLHQTIVWLFNSLGIGLIAFYSVTLFVPILITWGVKHNLVDLPDVRRLHKGSIPRIGGIAVFLGTIVSMALQQLVFSFWPPWFFDANQFWIYLSGACLIFFLGLIDDVKSLPAFYKLGGQIFIAVLMFYFGIQVYSFLGVELPYYIDLVFTILWFVLIINAFNLIDGFDGVASGLGFISGLGIVGSFVFRNLYIEAVFLLPLIFSCLGFLKFNRSPAKIFLGDSGSLFIGFSLAWITLATVSKGPGLAAIAVPFLALGVPMFDVFLAVWRRLVRKSFRETLALSKSVGIMSPDLDHLHHRLVKKGFLSHDVAGILYLTNCILVLIGLVSLIYREATLGIYVVFFALFIYIVIKHVAKVEIKESALVVNKHGAVIRLSLLNLGMFLAFDIVVMSIVLYFSCWIAYRGFLSPRDIVILWILQIPAWVGLPAIGLAFLEAYKTVRKRNLWGDTIRGRGVFMLVFGGVVFILLASLATDWFTWQRRHAFFYFLLIYIYAVVFHSLGGFYRKRLSKATTSL